MKRAALVIAAFAIVSLTGGRASAQRATDPTTQRRELIVRARAAANADDFGLALDLATRAASIEMTPSLRLFIAEQQARTGHWLDALSNATVCVTEARGEERAERRDAMIAACNELTENARAHVAWVRVHVEGSLEGVTASMNGRPLALTAAAPPLAVDPGPLVLEVFRDDQSIARRETVLTSGGAIDFPVRVTPRAGATVSTTSPARESRGSGADVHGARRRIAGPIALGSFGLASTLAAATLFALREISQGPCMPVGSDLVCPSQADVPAAEAAIRYNLAADVALGVGVAALAGAAIWLAVERRAPALRGSRAAIVPSAQGAQLFIGWSL